MEKLTTKCKCVNQIFFQATTVLITVLFTTGPFCGVISEIGGVISELGGVISEINHLVLSNLIGQKH